MSSPATAAFYSKLVGIFAAHGLTLQQAQGAALQQLANQVAAQARALAYQGVYVDCALLLLPAVGLALLLRTRRAAVQRQGVWQGEGQARPAAVESVA